MPVKALAAAFERPRPRDGNRRAFAGVALLFWLLCLRGGTLGYIGGASLSLWGFSIPAGGFVLLFALTWMVHIALLPLFPRELPRRRKFSEKPLSPGTDTRDGSNRGAGGIGRRGPLTASGTIRDVSAQRPKREALLLGLALLCRLALLPHPPSDDVNRYLWEGRLVAEGINPYQFAPNDPALSALAAADPFHAAVNQPDVPAAYPPLSLLLFAGTGRIAYGMGAMKLLILVFDMACVWLILRLLRHRALPERWAVLYAFNPVILYAFAGQAHLDAIQNAFLLAALVLFDRRRFGGMFLFLGLAVQSKYVAVLALPFLLRRENLRHLPFFLLGLLAPVAALLAVGIVPSLEGLSRFGAEFAFNGPVHAPLRFLVFDGDMDPARRVCQALLLIALAAGLWAFHPQRAPRHRDDPVSGVCFAMGALILLSPTVHFWYLSWVLIFLPLRPAASWTVASLTAGAYFVAVGISHETGRWDLPAAAQLVEWLPPGLFLLGEALRGVARFRAPVDPVPPRSVSVVIPAINEGERIGACIAAVRGDPAVAEVVLVDGGSGDDTVFEARRGGARVLFHRRPPEAGGGRGGQIRAGVGAAEGDVVAIVHADTRPPPGTFSGMTRLLRRNPHLIGGAWGGVFDGRGWRLRLLEFANDLRAAWGVSFGDQVQFFRRRPMAASGLFPDIPLMEDVELSLRMGRLGGVTFRFGDARISPRRWRAGIGRRGGLVLRLVAAYFWRRLWGRPDTVAMFRRYYNAGPQKITANRDRPD